MPENLFRFIRSDIVPSDVKDVGFVPIEARASCHLSKCIPIVWTLQLARLLGLTRNALRYRLSQMGIGGS